MLSNQNRKKKRLRVSHEREKAEDCFCVNTTRKATSSALNGRRRYGPSVPPQMDTLVKKTSDMEVGLKRTRSGRIIKSTVVSQPLKTVTNCLLTLLQLDDLRPFILCD